jgi:hypothetical protein
MASVERIRAGAPPPDAQQGEARTTVAAAPGPKGKKTSDANDAAGNAARATGRPHQDEDTPEAERERIGLHDRRIIELRRRAELLGCTVHVVPGGVEALRWGRCTHLSIDELEALVRRLEGSHAR